MRRPGNPVTARFIDTTYLLDSDFFKRKNKEFDRILKLREPNFGNPHKDIKINKETYSSLFLKEAYYASIIIKNIQEKKIANPVIVEIGAGIGLLALILQKYFGKKSKIVLIDVPEILSLQKIYIKSIFKNHLKYSDIIKKQIKSNFTFLNHNNYNKHKFKFDVVINFDSMNLIEKKYQKIFYFYTQKYFR